MSQIGTENKVFVRIPVRTAALAKIPAGTKTAFGINAASTTLATLGTGASIIDFAGNHKKVMRVTVHPGLLTPIPQNTTWGTRVVKMTDKSYSFPVGGDDIDQVITAFQAAFTGAGAMKSEMGNADSPGYAVLRLGNTVLSTAKA